MQWISVKDKLPEETEMVLLYFEEEYFFGVIQIVYSDGCAVFKEWMPGGMYNIPATHWAKLEPPTP